MGFPVLFSNYSLILKQWNGYYYKTNVFSAKAMGKTPHKLHRPKVQGNPDFLLDPRGRQMGENRRRGSLAMCTDSQVRRGIGEKEGKKQEWNTLGLVTDRAVTWSAQTPSQITICKGSGTYRQLRCWNIYFPKLLLISKCLHSSLGARHCPWPSIYTNSFN